MGRCVSLSAHRTGWVFTVCPANYFGKRFNAGFKANLLPGVGGCYRSTDGWFPVFWQLGRWLRCTGGRKGNTQAYEANHSSTAIISRVTPRRLHGEPCWNQMDAGVYTNKLAHTCTLSLTCPCTCTGSLLWETNQPPAVSDRGGQFSSTCTSTNTHSWMCTTCCSRTYCAVPSSRALFFYWTHMYECSMGLPSALIIFYS